MADEKLDRALLLALSTFLLSRKRMPYHRTDPLFLAIPCRNKWADRAPLKITQMVKLYYSEIIEGVPKIENPTRPHKKSNF